MIWPLSLNTLVSYGNRHIVACFQYLQGIDQVQLFYLKRIKGSGGRHSGCVFINK